MLTRFPFLFIDNTQVSKPTPHTTSSVSTRTHASWLKRYVPLLLWLGFIFYGSSDQMSASNTSWIITSFARWFSPDVSDAALNALTLLVRKTAHFTEYAILALLTARVCLTSTSNLLRRHWLALSFALVAFCALSDELHQSFVASRTGSIYDSLLDMIGGLTALIVLEVWRRWVQQ